MEKSIKDYRPHAEGLEHGPYYSDGDVGWNDNLIPGLDSLQIDASLDLLRIREENIENAVLNGDISSESRDVLMDEIVQAREELNRQEADFITNMPIKS